MYWISLGYGALVMVMQSADVTKLDDATVRPEYSKGDCLRPIDAPMIGNCLPAERHSRPD